MKNFLRATFKITIVQVLVILFFSLLKYFLTRYNLTDKIQTPFLFFCFGVGIYFMTALSIAGEIENRGLSYESWQAKEGKARRQKLMAMFVNVGLTTPPIIGSVVFLYLIAPGSWTMAAVIIAGTLAWNTFKYFSAKANEQLN